MDHHIKEFFSQFRDDTPKGNFHKVISLKDTPLDWDAASKLAPGICKGWVELARLDVADRIEFTRDYWLSKFPYHQHLFEFITRFFSALDDVVVFIVQNKFDDLHEAQLVYSLKDNKGFFRGLAPMTDNERLALQKQFGDIIFPEDYLAFLQIHNGFCKTTDCTGVMSSKIMKEKYDQFQLMFSNEQSVSTNKGVVIDPTRLIPFYESFGMPFFQCFWADWYPEQEMGNVYFSGAAKTISDIGGRDSSAENMSFPTFTDWLMFYMELIT